MRKATLVTIEGYAYGLDLSLLSTGVVVFNLKGEVVHAATIKTKSKGMRRLLEIETELNNTFDTFFPLFICVEDYAKGAKGMVFNIGELGGVIKLLMFRRGFKYLDVTPTTLKKFVTGKGNSPKEEMMLSVYENWGYRASGNDIADAYGLAKIAHSILNKEYKGLKTHQQEVIRLLSENLKAIKR